MKFCIDYQPAVQQVAGIGRYTRVLAAELAAMLPPEDSLKLFYYNFTRKIPTPSMERVETRSFRLLPGRIVDPTMNWFGIPFFDWLAGDADVFHFTNFIAKPFRRGKAVASVHDMSFVRFPQFAAGRNLAYLDRGLRRTVDSTELILTISEFSKREIEEILPETRGRVRTTLLGISEDFKPAAPAEIEAVKKQLGLERPFVLTVGTVEPRKNLPFLVSVFERLAPLGIDLVVAGAPGWRYEPIFESFAKAEAKFPGRFHYVRFVPDGCLGALYSAASLFAVASFYEGFGFPPLEAMACGAPVLSSDGGSLPEVLGNAARVMSGFDADEWAAAALEIIQAPPDKRAEIVIAGQAQAAKYRWRKCAEETLAVYREAASNT